MLFISSFFPPLLILFLQLWLPLKIILTFAPRRREMSFSAVVFHLKYSRNQQDVHPQAEKHKLIQTRVQVSISSLELIETKM